MENSKKKSSGVEIPKRNRSLDLKSLYESRLSEVGENKKKVSDEKDGEFFNKKRKSRKEVPLSCFESDAKKSRKEDATDVPSELGSRQRSNSRSEGLHGISLSLGDNSSSFNIPKRRRGLVGRKKLESNQGSNNLRLPNSVDRAASKGEVIRSDSEVDPSDRLVQLVALSADNRGTSSHKSAGKVIASVSKSKKKTDSKSNTNSSSSTVKLKSKVEADEVKENRNGRLGVGHVVKGYDRAVNDSDMPPKKRQTNSRKKKNPVVGRDGGEASTKKSEPSVGSSVSNPFIDFVDDEDDDEENLEQNAARMLSSRFDPSCTGFSLKRIPSVSQMADGSSFPASSARGSSSRLAKSMGGGASASADDKSRALRPRKEDKGKGMSRKRRHFYEILARELDPYWVLNRRIKIFWPLDESWYYGLVNDYHSETKLHHIKYDDRDEEWVNLQEEKFKLLLLPNEVPSKVKSRKQPTADKNLHTGLTVPPADDDSCRGDYLDSEPIASWLAGQSQHVKASSKSLKRQRRQNHPPLASSLSYDKTNNINSNLADSNLPKDKLDFESASRDDNLVSGKVDKCQLGTARSSQSGMHVVYVRKKYQKKGEGGSSGSRDVKGRSAPCTVTPLSPVTVGMPTTKDGRFYHGCVDSGKQVWSFDKGKLRLNDVLLESKELSFRVCLPRLSFLEFCCGTGVSWLLHDIFMLQHGVVVTTSPAVILEMLFVDSKTGLRFLVFEGCLKQALAFVFLILIVFSQSDMHWRGDVKLPVTSIRFQLSSVQDLRKHHVFSFYSFSRLQSSKWLYLDSKILQHCHLIKKLPVSECTYDNIKELEYGSGQKCRPHVGLELYSNKGFKNKISPGILPMGFSREACNTMMRQSAFSLAAKPGKVPQFALSFSAAPSFFLTLHLQLLMEHSFAWVNRQHQDPLCSPESSENGPGPVAECSKLAVSSVAVQDVTVEHETRKLDKDAPAFRGFSSYQQDFRMGVVFSGNAARNTDSSEKLQKRNPEDDRMAGCSTELTETTAPGVIAQSQQSESKEMQEQIVISAPASLPTSTTSPTPYPRNDSTSGAMVVIPSFEQGDIPSAGKGFISRQTSDVGWNVHDGFVRNRSPTGSRSSWKHGKSSLDSFPLAHSPGGKRNLMPNGFSNGPRKPRTQVQYTLPFVDYDLNAKRKIPSSRTLPCKRIRRASLKSISDGSENNGKSLDLIICVANVLVTYGDKGWRECGAHIVLEAADQNEWKLAVKLSGVIKYSYKVKHIMQPGSANRFSHAMMWKGGKDWVLEFPDRNQWMLFKEMHEECYNRNIRAASVKNIPIPGVRLVEESDDYGTEVPFARNCKYFHQLQNDVEMAMDPSHILYDMDSDDELWLMANQNSTDKHKYQEISEEFLEKVMDLFEKVSYSQRRDNFTDAEIGDIVIGVGPVEAAKVIYEHWRQKREKLGMPLIRHLQPPLWERYQRQLKEWEHDVTRRNCAFSLGRQEKFPRPEKPPVFAFCFRPRGLDVPNKGSKQRSHRKFPVSGHHHASSADPDSLVFGRRSNGHAFGEEKVFYASSMHDASDVSPSIGASRRLLSPRDAHFSLSSAVSEWKGNPKVYKQKSKKLGSYLSFRKQEQALSYKRTNDNRNGAQQWNMGPSELSSQRHFYSERPQRPGLEQLDSSDLYEFQLHEASNAARRAVKLAKVKKERAQRLHSRADLTVHKAAVALMTAEAMKESCSENSNGVN